MTQDINDYIEFDERVERFLKNQMTPEEEKLFRSELNDDPDKKARAKVIALMTKEMSEMREDDEVAFVSVIKNLSAEEYEEISDNVRLTYFDEEVTRFLKKQMNESEETAFKAKLKGNKALEDRAKAIALTIKEMSSINEQQDKQVIEQISGMSESQFRNETGLPSKVISIVLKKDIVAACSIPDKSESQFRNEAGQPSKVISIKPFLRKNIVAACIAGLIIFGGVGIGTLQLTAYNQTTSIGEKYYAEVPNSVGSYRADIDKDALEHLEMLFRNVKKAVDLDETIDALSQTYEDSSDEGNELNYLRNEIAWNLAMAHLKTGNRKAARPVLEDIINNTDSGRPLHDYAEKALNEIDNIISVW